MNKNEGMFEVLVGDPDKDGKCTMCMDNMAEITFTGCGHKLFCIACYIHGFSDYKKCSTCDMDTDIIKGDIDKLLKLITSDMLNKGFYEFLSSYLDMITVTSNPKKAIKEITNQYKEYYDSSLYHSRITVSQTEILLQKCISKGFFDPQTNSHYQLRNLLVALCIEPWRVDLKLGGHGVCYHGNMGDAPSIRKLVELLYYNNDKLLNNTF